MAAGRLGRTLLVLAAVAGLVVIGGSSVSRTVVAWLHRRPEYRIKFSEIALDPPPPPWIKGGRESLLEVVRDGRKHLETLSILDLNLDHLLTDFRRNPWVARVERAEKSYSNRLSVSLAYREPVALVHAGPGPPTPVDRDAVALPADELDIPLAGPLASIEAEPPPSPPRAGLAWPGVGPGPGPAARVLLAARLAGRLKDHLRSVKPGDWSPKSIRLLVHEPGQVGFWVKFDETFVLWGRYAHLDDPSEPSDDEKWQRLSSKAKQEGGLKPPPSPDEYLSFGPDGLRVQRSSPNPDDGAL